MTRTTTSVRLPVELVEAIDERAAALGITRSQLIMASVEQALEVRSPWSPAFLEAIGSPRRELEGLVNEMMRAIRARRGRPA